MKKTQLKQLIKEFLKEVHRDLDNDEDNIFDMDTEEGEKMMSLIEKKLRI